MPKKSALPTLLPNQVVRLYDELLANADRLLTSALTLLESGNKGLARSLAILGLEESGKAIAIHERRAEIAYEPEGAPFVSPRLEKLWGDHKLKLRLTYDFLVAEKYWFATEPADPEANRAWLGEIDEWSRQQNLLKQRGFYVDVDDQQGLLLPEADVDEESLRQVVSHVHQIGWQLRLGEHIVAKEQKRSAQAVEPASEDEICSMRETLVRASVDEAIIESICDNMRQGTPATLLNNNGYRFHLPAPGSNPFATLGQRGYEAQTRELQMLAEEIGIADTDSPD